MKVSNDLFHLIHSLTRSEKRYFKLSAAPQKAKGEANYLKLFDAIEKQAAYDEEKLKKQFSGTAFIKHLPSEKNYLYALIIRSLVKYHASASEEIELDDLLHAAELLYKKGLYEQSSKMLTRAMEFAMENELYSRIFKIEEIRLHLIPQVASSAETMLEEYEQSFARVRTAFEKLENQSRYNELHARFYRMIRKEGELIRTSAELSRFAGIMKDPLLQDEKHALTRLSRRMFFFIHATYNHITGNLPKAYYYETRELAELESDKKMMAEASLVYTARVSNICETTLRMKDFNLCRRYMDKLKNAPAEFPLEKARLFYRYYDFSLRMHVLMGEFDDAIALIKPIEAGFEKYKENIHKSRQISIYYYFAYACIGKGDFKQALGWINKVMEEKTDLRSDLLCYARLLNCIIHFELGNYLQLEPAYKSAQYFFSRRQKLYGLESTFLKYFRKLSGGPAAGEAAKLLHAFRQELDRVLRDPQEKAALEYFDLPAWLAGKTDNITFAEAVQARLPR